MRTRALASQHGTWWRASSPAPSIAASSGRATAVDRSTLASSTLAPDATPEDAAAAALLLDPEFVEIARDELARAAAEIEGVMEGWGFYEDPAHFADNPDARLTGDPRDEWDCGAPS